MTLVSESATTNSSSALVAEFAQSGGVSVDFMIGIGLVKDSDAVFFQYQGDQQKQALVQSNGKPVTRIAPVKLTGVAVEDNPYEGFESSGKLNIFLQTQQGKNIMLTSGLTTMWSQCMLISLVGLQQSNSLDSLISIDTWKGNSKYGTCFAAIRNNGAKVTNDEMYNAFAKARTERNSALKQQIARDAVGLLRGALEVETVVVDEPKADF